MSNERKKRKEVNQLYREIVEQYKADFDKELKIYKGTAKEKQREKEIADNFIYSHIIGIEIVLIVVAIVFAFLYGKGWEFAIGYVVSAAMAILSLVYYQRKIDSEVKRNADLKDMRKRIWIKAIEEKARGKYSRDLYVAHLLAYHENSLMHRIVVLAISFSFVIITVYVFRDLSATDLVSFIVACGVNIISNLLGNWITSTYAEDYYFETLKNDLLD